MPPRWASPSRGRIPGTRSRAPPRSYSNPSVGTPCCPAFCSTSARLTQDISAPSRKASTSRRDASAPAEIGQVIVMSAASRRFSSLPPSHLPAGPGSVGGSRRTPAEPIPFGHFESPRSTRLDPSGDGVNELRELAKAPSLEHPVACRRIRLHDRIRGVPVGTGLRIEPIHLPHPLMDQRERAVSGSSIVVPRIARDDDRGSWIQVGDEGLHLGRHEHFTEGGECSDARADRDGIPPTSSPSISTSPMCRPARISKASLSPPNSPQLDAESARCSRAPAAARATTE
jgi:hypothetical protein